MSLRNRLRLTLALFSVSLVVGAGALYLTTNRLSAAASALFDTTERAQTAGDLAVSASRYRRLSSVLAADSDPQLAADARAELEALRAHASELRALTLPPGKVAPGNEAAAASRYLDSVETAITRIDEAEARGLSGVAFETFLQDAGEQLRVTRDAFVSANVAAAEDLRAHSALLDEGADALSFLLLALALALAALTFTLVRRGFVEPSRRLIAGLRRLGREGPGPLGLHLPSEFGEAEAAIDALSEQLVREQKGRARFLGAVAHDLRTPLTAMKMQCVLASPERGADEERLRRALKVVSTQLDRLVAQVDDLLDASRIEAGELSLNPRDVDLAAAAREAGDLYRAASPKHVISVAGASPLDIRADPVRLQQVLTNLVSNAVKYSPAGGRVRVTVAREQDYAVLAVCDEGLGIAPDEVQRLFEPFQRGRLVQRTGIAGTGLGLAVTRRIVEAHGGWVTVESAPGRGSTFRVYLPVARGDGAAARAALLVPGAALVH